MYVYFICVCIYINNIYIWNQLNNITIYTFKFYEDFYLDYYNNIIIPNDILLSNKQCDDK